MPIVRIMSLDDPRLDPYRELKRSKADKQSGYFIAEGMWLVRRLVESHFRTQSILLDEHRLVEVGVAIPADVDLYLVPDGWTEKVIGFNFHRGIVACGHRPERSSAPSVPSLANLDQTDWLIVACVDVQDPENIGGILRNAAAFGARAVVLGPKCSDPFSRRVLRVSMGAPFKMEIVESNDLMADLDELRRRYQAVVAATVLDDQAEHLESFVRPPRLVLVFGSEGFGLTRDWWSFSDVRLTIPMSRQADSLNVSVASGVFLHCLTRFPAGVTGRTDDRQLVE